MANEGLSVTIPIESGSRVSYRYPVIRPLRILRVQSQTTAALNVDLVRTGWMKGSWKYAAWQSGSRYVSLYDLILVACAFNR